MKYKSPTYRMSASVVTRQFMLSEQRHGARPLWVQDISLLEPPSGVVDKFQIIGATNPKGEEPVERAMTPNDLWATVYQHLGVDYTHEFPDHAGRPMPMLPFGEPIPELRPVT